MKKNNSCIGIFSNHTDAEQAIKELQISGFDMKKLSIVGKGYHSDEHPVGYYNTGDRFKFWGKLGAFWGECRDCCSAQHFFGFPVSGPWPLPAP